MSNPRVTADYGRIEAGDTRSQNPNDPLGKVFQEPHVGDPLLVVRHHSFSLTSAVQKVEMLGTGRLITTLNHRYLIGPSGDVFGPYEKDATIRIPAEPLVPSR